MSTLSFKGDFRRFFLFGVLVFTDVNSLCAQQTECNSSMLQIQDAVVKNRLNALDEISAEQRGCIYDGISLADAGWIKLARPLLEDAVKTKETNRSYDLMVSLGDALEISPTTVFENIPADYASDILELACVSVAPEKIEGGANLADTGLSRRKEKLMALQDAKWLSYRNSCLGAIEKTALKEQQRLGCLG
jgi:hypothetical protein